MAGLCADCTACCTVFEVRELEKAFGQPCKHLGKSTTVGGPGCTIYAERPQACVNYVCLYLDSQRRKDVERMPEELRPNVSHVLLGWPWGIERNTLHVYPLPGFPNAWREGKVAIYLRELLAKGAKLVVYVNSKEVYAINGDAAVRGTEEEFAELLSRNNENVDQIPSRV